MAAVAEMIAPGFYRPDYTPQPVGNGCGCDSRSGYGCCEVGADAPVIGATLLGGGGPGAQDAEPKLYITGVLGERQENLIECDPATKLPKAGTGIRCAWNVLALSNGKPGAPALMLHLMKTEYRLGPCDGLKARCKAYRYVMIEYKFLTEPRFQAVEQYAFSPKDPGCSYKQEGQYILLNHGSHLYNQVKGWLDVYIGDKSGLAAAGMKNLIKNVAKGGSFAKKLWDGVLVFSDRDDLSEWEWFSGYFEWIKGRFTASDGASSPTGLCEGSWDCCNPHNKESKQKESPSAGRRGSGIDDGDPFVSASTPLIDGFLLQECCG